MPKYDKDGKVKSVNAKSATKYDGKVAERYLDLCKKGGTTVQFCRNEGISRQTFDNWCENYPDLKEAKARGKAYAEAWWLDQAQAHLVTYSSKDDGSYKFDTSLYKFYMGGRFLHTSEGALLKILQDMQRKQELILSQANLTPQFAEEAEYTLDDSQA